MTDALETAARAICRSGAKCLRAEHDMGGTCAERNDTPCEATRFQLLASWRGTAATAVLAALGADWQPPETAPKTGAAFLITTAGPEIDLCYWDRERGEFRDYHFGQKVAPWWPYMIAWKPRPEPAIIRNTEQATREANGWPRFEAQTPTTSETGNA